ncbi:MAG: hypothetical protein QHC90_08345 [Shinella sp.]|nr:hypothetical protein [Shinella sp.]
MPMSDSAVQTADNAAAILPYADAQYRYRHGSAPSMGHIMLDFLERAGHPAINNGAHCCSRHPHKI